MSDATTAGVSGPRHAAGGRLKLVEGLHDVVSGINAGLDLDAVLERICTTAIHLVDADLGIFLRLDGPRWRPTVVRRGGGAEEWDEVAADCDDWMTQLVRDGGDWCAFPVDDVSPVMVALVAGALPDARTSMAAAARASAHPSGALAVVYSDSRRTPEPAEIDVLVLLAQHAGVALTHADSMAKMARDRQHQHVIVDATSDGLAVLDDDGRVLQWNRAASRLTGLSGDQVVGKPPPFPVSEPGQVLDHRLPTGRWVEILSSTVPGSDDLVVEIRDVSQAKELERVRDLFLATAAHELRTPVTAVHGFSSTLLQRWDELSDTGRRAAAEVVADRSSALAALVDKVVLGATVGADEPEVVVEPVDLVAALSEILAEYTPPSDRHRVVFDGTAVISPARCDPRTLPETVHQVLENAVKFSPDGGDIVVEVSDDGDQVGFSVRDEGVGVSTDDVAGMFDLFYTGGTGDRRQFGGLGIGLYIVRQLVRAQQGSVGARQVPEGGTEVAVCLPRWRGAPSTPISHHVDDCR